ncbi:MAG: Eco57I restriction-modification methylase domain-containing protein [Candidatus Cloacimonetes bacterium]|nr:Eco57I restriction-modification methylase domain-containing protein [Candidatus Cloacimonadota bacterium]
MNLENRQHNVDVLNFLANLSSDEVFTPPDLANQILDLLPAELWSNKEAKFLDPACKSGVFLREIAKRLNEGLKEQITDLQTRLNHIYTKQLYGIAITELTALLARRTLYCSKEANGKYSVCDAFNSKQGNIVYDVINHTYENDKCIYCGANKEVYERDEGLESYAYQFIHSDNLEEIFNMKFDVIIGNPPYQMSDGGAAASAKPIYNLFVDQAKKLNPRYLVMIIPARWYAGGKGLDEFRSSMLSDKQITKLVDYADSSECFTGVNIAGGVCYFLWEKGKSEQCKVVNIRNGKENSMKRDLDEYSMFVRDNISVEILRKILSVNEKTMFDLVKARNSFGLTTTFKGDQNQNGIIVLTSKGEKVSNIKNINDRDKILEDYKVIITYAMSGGHKPSSGGDYVILSSLQVIPPNEAFTETYLCIGNFKNEEPANNLLSYAKTKLFRFLLLQALTSIHISKEKFLFVPLQDFSKPWTDEELYKKYNLSEDEIDFIESMIKPME